jgi:hypothetical protein
MNITDKAAELMERAKRHYDNTVSLYNRAIAVAKAAAGSVHEAEAAKEVDALVKEMYDAEAFKNEMSTAADSQSKAIKTSVCDATAS